MAMGLVNRVVEKGTVLEEAQRLAGEIARFPQLCMRADRRAAYRSFDLSFEHAMQQEFLGGLEVIEGEAIPGAQRFADGLGRHGSFEEI